MGLLTDPNPGQGKFTKLLLKTRGRLCALSYIAGIAWFLCLAHKHFNNGRYFSENALLPGLVRGEFNEDNFAKHLHEELKRVMDANPSAIPYSWLRAQFSQMHLDSYLHNYTVSYPLGSNGRYSGQNVYAVLRAPRSSSLEGLVLSAPFRTRDSPHPDNTAGIALLLAIAKFCRRQKYWAKDIVFLITDNEQLGTHAWLEAYHDISVGSGALDSGEVKARAGAIQAAVNLELRSFKLSHIDVKVEGLNGQLPNLDLVNLVHKLCGKEGIRHTFKNRTNPRKRDTPFDQWYHGFSTLMSMVLTQASCVPSGNHGLYHRFGIEVTVSRFPFYLPPVPMYFQAITLEGHEPQPGSRQQVSGVFQAGRVMEGVLRSLNNLLERFHQSYFFYLLPSNDRFISIGLYMPVVGLIGAPLLVKALTIWLKIYSELKTESTAERSPGIRPTRIGIVWLISHVFGLSLVHGTAGISRLSHSLLGMSAPPSMYLTHLLLFGLSLLGPVVWGLRPSETDALSIIALVQLATVLLTVAMQNFSLSFLIAAVLVPVVLCVTPLVSKRRRIFQSLALLLVHPFILLHVCVTIYTAVHLELGLSFELLEKSWLATQSSLVYFLVDGVVYGNWFQDAIFGFITPCWLMFWVLAHSTTRDEKHLKTD